MNDMIFEKVAMCIHRATEKEDIPIEYCTRLQEDLKMESLQLVILQVELEDAFCFTFDPLEDNFRLIFQTAGSVYDYIMEHS